MIIRVQVINGGGGGVRFQGETELGGGGGVRFDTGGGGGDGK